MGGKANLLGRKFGALTVVAAIRMTKSGMLWRCVCACGGGERVFVTSALKSIANPGCKACEPERRGAIHRVHGEAGRGRLSEKKSKLYMVWKGMLSRCRDPGNTSYRYYGSRGVSVCEEWQDFPSFRSWALANGYVPGLSIDRFDPRLDYHPANCEFVTRSENSRRNAAWRRQWKI